MTIQIMSMNQIKRESKIISNDPIFFLSWQKLDLNLTRNQISPQLLIFFFYT